MDDGAEVSPGRVLSASAVGWTVGAGVLGYLGLQAGLPTESWIGPDEMWVGGLAGATIGSALGAHLSNNRRGNPWLAGVAGFGAAAFAAGATDASAALDQCPAPANQHRRRHRARHEPVIRPY